MMLRYCANLKAIRYEPTDLNRIVADKSHHVIAALDVVTAEQQIISCKAVNMAGTGIKNSSGKKW